MSDYTLYYWPAPFRGQFVRAVLEHMKADWREASIDAVIDLMDAAPDEQPTPLMAPPILADHTADLTLSQTSAILGYLGRKHRLMPSDAKRAALTNMILADVDDILYEMTRYNGAQMWTQPEWDAYQPRLGRWMDIFDAIGRRHGLTARAGHMLGTRAFGLADLAMSVLWRTMTDCLPPLRPLLDEREALAGLCDRVAALPEQAALIERSRAAYGDSWCGGQIEASLREVL